MTAQAANFIDAFFTAPASESDPAVSSVLTRELKRQQDQIELQIVVTAGDPYTDSVHDYVERLIVLEVNSEQLLPARRPSATPKALVN